MEERQDLISRQAAIDAVNRLSLGETDAVRLSMRIADYLNRMPSAQPTFDARDTQYNLPIGTDCISRQTAIEELTDRNVGKWIIKDNPGTGWYRVTCSACGEDVTSTAPVIGFFPNAKITWNYCPECGSYNGGDDDV